MTEQVTGSDVSAGEIYLQRLDALVEMAMASKTPLVGNQPAVLSYIVEVIVKRNNVRKDFYVPYTHIYEQTGISKTSAYKAVQRMLKERILDETGTRNVAHTNRASVPTYKFHGALDKLIEAYSNDTARIKRRHKQDNGRNNSSSAAKIRELEQRIQVLEDRLNTFVPKVRRMTPKEYQQTIGVSDD